MEFDDLLLLGKGGRVIYHGPLQEAPSYFESIGFPVPISCNPADFYLDVAAGVIPHKTDPNFEWPKLFDYWESHRISNADENGPSVARRFTFSQASMTETQSYRKELEDMESHSAAQMTETAVNAVKSLYYEAEDYLVTFYEDSKQAIVNFGKPDPIRETPNSFQQFQLCLMRAFKQVFRKFQFFIMEMMLHLGAGFVISVAANRLEYIGPYPGTKLNCITCLIMFGNTDGA